MTGLISTTISGLLIKSKEDLQIRRDFIIESFPILEGENGSGISMVETEEIERKKNSPVHENVLVVTKVLLAETAQLKKIVHLRLTRLLLREPIGSGGGVALR